MKEETYTQIIKLLLNINMHKHRVIDAKTQSLFTKELSNWISVVLHNDTLKYIYFDGKSEFKNIRDTIGYCSIEEQIDAMRWVLDKNYKSNEADDLCRVLSVYLAEKAHKEKLNILCLYNGKFGYVPHDDLCIFAEMNSPDWYNFPFD